MRNYVSDSFKDDFKYREGPAAIRQRKSILIEDSKSPKLDLSKKIDRLFIVWCVLMKGVFYDAICINMKCARRIIQRIECSYYYKQIKL